ncbi:TetR/AcrR family transcriptional regulator [Geodermatophilus sabuli]|jgi:AcrR family transcriptional regulator|uniref:Transcriptional regulator, TetR family n=1 Tax=Geodermatophilus sabuli TaxID=1564158 RepID=A0A285ECW2_9ACTN|nr:TetR/AcrR family transcriptional regulator [Geodermatophilus sabuli]MBB3083297.1 AcrR family transcriptional regulator [Geodermatophilus sabuli]SNX96982.1 transcriptional regulator, TetR family [Geodermatophilus sabuli]
MPPDRPYHHGDLRQAVLAAAVDALTESGPARLSLRDLARRAGVSHAAPAHHFGDKAGLLTAVAAEGYNLLADTLTAAQQRTADFLDVGVAYVRFAVDHRAHFEVMFRPDLYHPDDPAVAAARQRAADALYGGVRSVTATRRGPDIPLAGIAAWSLVHGFATLWLNHALPPGLGDDPQAAARAVAAIMFRTP